MLLTYIAFWPIYVTEKTKRKSIPKVLVTMLGAVRYNFSSSSIDLSKLPHRVCHILLDSLLHITPIQSKCTLLIEIYMTSSNCTLSMQMVKDHRTNFSSPDTKYVLDGGLTRYCFSFCYRYVFDNEHGLFSFMEEALLLSANNANNDK